MRRKTQLIVFAILSLLVLAFIFSNSLQTAEVSAQRSGSLSGGLKAFFDPHNRLTLEQFDHYVRKAAHFSEFAALGFFLMGFYDAALKKGKAVQRLIAWGTAVAAAIADECLQFFSEGRAPGVKDVCIDCAGALCGVLVMCFFLWLFRRKKRAA